MVPNPDYMTLERPPYGSSILFNYYKCKDESQCSGGRYEVEVVYCPVPNDFSMCEILEVTQSIEGRIGELVQR